MPAPVSKQLVGTGDHQRDRAERAVEQAALALGHRVAGEAALLPEAHRQERNRAEQDQREGREQPVGDVVPAGSDGEDQRQQRR